ncbi:MULTISPECIES: TspO protein [unclassified Brevundimonas]|uniref:TspO protein n=1 Tax=unclassified Brevundimonas TaxID=2622653 RepID=UPI0025BBF72A|nr:MULTISPECIES: TspO protein [unclassified Brevundimonas]
MEEIEDLIDTARDKADEFLNIGSRDWGHVATGALLTAGFALAVTVLAREIAPEQTPRTFSRRMRNEVKAGNWLMPAVFSANSLSALRVWNSPAQKGRVTAMGLWALAQTANAWWLAARPQKRWSQIGAAMLSAGLAAAFAYEARRLRGVSADVDPVSAATNFVK